MFQDKALTVTQLNGYIKDKLAQDVLLRGLLLRGEISGFKRHSSGHLYFSLKDDQSVLRCVMFRQNAMMLPLQPRDGMKVQASGYVSFFPRDGALQFYCEGMRDDGQGALHQAYEELKARLAAEGLFDLSRKRPLPTMPRRIALVTSPTGAVVRDMLRVAGRRNPALSIVVVPAQVQGEGAAASIVKALRKAAELPEVDVILCGRGGGSIEDLWAFNEEAVVRAVAASPLPVVSAVGHETDVTLCDFAADVRAATPSQAAELAVPDVSVLLERRDRTTERLHLLIKAHLTRAESALMQLAQRRVLRYPDEMVLHMERHLAQMSSDMRNKITARLERGDLRADALAQRMEALSPLAVLSRGYALVEDGAGRVLRQAGQVQPGESFRVRMSDGAFAARREVEDGQSS